MTTAGDRYDVLTGNIWSYARRGDMTGVKTALQRNPDTLNLQNTVGWTACHAAASANSTRCLKMLIRAGADINIRDRGGSLAIHEAAKNGHVQSLNILATAGADISVIRLSQTKGQAVRDMVVEAYKTAGDDGKAAEEAPAMGYNRKQVKSNAFYGPRKTPISGKLKKEILQRKNEAKREKKERNRMGDSEVPSADIAGGGDGGSGGGDELMGCTSAHKEELTELGAGAHEDVNSERLGWKPTAHQIIKARRDKRRARTSTAREKERPHDEHVVVDSDKLEALIDA